MSIIGAFILPHPPIILPEVGKGEEKKISRTVEAYESVAELISMLKPDTIIISSPHAVSYMDHFHVSPGRRASGNFGRFGAEEVEIRVKYDEELAGLLAVRAFKRDISAGFAGEEDRDLDHGTLVPLYFLQRQYDSFELVRIGLSGYSLKEHFRFGQSIREAVEDLGRRVVFIASGDLSHRLKKDGPYGFRKEGVEFDQRITEAMSRGDFQAFMDFDEDLLEAAGECGLRSFIIMAGALDGQAVDAKLLSYEGIFGVGYAVASFLPKSDRAEEPLTDALADEDESGFKGMKERGDPYVRLAREALENYVQHSSVIQVPLMIPSEMTAQRRGVFVSLKINGELRGCIGTVEANEDSIAEEIIRNAISAGTRDPRFKRVSEQELPLLEYSVDVLGSLTPVKDLQELDPRRYGILVSTETKSGLLLPDLEGVDTVKDQVAIALRKAGISSRESYLIRRFEVTRHR